MAQKTSVLRFLCRFYDFLKGNSQKLRYETAPLFPSDLIRVPLGAFPSQMGKHVPQALVKHQVGVTVVGRLIPIDEHQATSPIKPNETGGRVNGQAGTCHYEEVRFFYGGNTVRQRLFVQALLI